MFRAVSLVLFGLAMQATTAWATDWPAYQAEFSTVTDALAQGRPIQALETAESCQTQNPLCGWYLLANQWHLMGISEHRERLSNLRHRHDEAMQQALDQALPEAITLDVLERASPLPWDDTDRETILAHLEPALEADYAWAYWVAGELRTYREFDIRSREGLPYFIRASELGFRQAMIQVAEVLVCRKCPGPPEDLKGWGWLNQAVVLEYPPAMTRMGAWYSEGYVVGKNPQQARTLLEQALQYGDANAHCHLADLAIYGRGMATDETKARDGYLTGLEAGGTDCAAHLAHAYHRNWISSDTSEEDDRVYLQCAEQGDAQCAVRLGREWVWRYSDEPESANPGLALLQSLKAKSPEAAVELGDFYRSLDTTTDVRRAFKAYRLALGDEWAQPYKELVTLVMDNPDAFTTQEKKEVDVWLSRAIDLGSDNLAFGLTVARAFGKHLEADADEARRWGWAALNSATDSNKKRLLRIFEAESTFVDDERFKWAVRYMTGESTADSDRVHHYVERLDDGHSRQKEVAVRELEAYVEDPALGDLAFAGLTLAYADPSMPQYDKARFQERARQLLDTADLDEATFYRLARRAHLSRYQISDQDLALALLQRSGEDGWGYMARLVSRDIYGLKDVEAATELLEKLARSETSYNGGFYRELGRYASFEEYGIHRPDLADRFFTQAIAKGEESALPEMLVITDTFPDYGEASFRQRHYEALDPARRADLTPLEQLVLARRLTWDGQFNDDQFLRAGAVLKTLASLDVEEHGLIVDYARASLVTLIEDVPLPRLFTPMEERAFLTQCVGRSCPASAKSRLAVNWVSHEPRLPDRAEWFMAGYEPDNAHDLENTLQYYALTGDIQRWQSLIRNSDSAQSGSRRIIHFLTLEPLPEYPRDFVYDMLGAVTEPPEGTLDALILLLDRERLRPSTADDWAVVKPLFDEIPQGTSLPAWLRKAL